MHSNDIRKRILPNQNQPPEHLKIFDDEFNANAGDTKMSMDNQNCIIGDSLHQAIWPGLIRNLYLFFPMHIYVEYMRI